MKYNENDEVPEILADSNGQNQSQHNIFPFENIFFRGALWEIQSGTIQTGMKGALFTVL